MWIKSEKFHQNKNHFIPNMDTQSIGNHYSNQIIELFLKSRTKKKIKHMIKLPWMFVCFVWNCNVKLFCVYFDWDPMSWKSSKPLLVPRMNFFLFGREWFTCIYLGSFYLNLFDFIENSHFMKQQNKTTARKWGTAVLKKNQLRSLLLLL